MPGQCLYLLKRYGKAGKCYKIVGAASSQKVHYVICYQYCYIMCNAGVILGVYFECKWHNILVQFKAASISATEVVYSSLLLLAYSAVLVFKKNTLNRYQTTTGITIWLSKRRHLGSAFHSNDKMQKRIVYLHFKFLHKIGDVTICFQSGFINITVFANILKMLYFYVC